MPSDANHRDPVARAHALVSLFSGLPEAGRFRSVSAADVPEPARSLLDHCSHMTVAVERFHAVEVRLRVVATVTDATGTADHWYAREILLESPAGDVVQYGIVRIDLSAVDEATAREIRAARRPLGRVLIDAGVLREVHDVSLLEVAAGPHLAELFRLPATAAARQPLYGRVASILLNERPAVELLEIVAPC